MEQVYSEEKNAGQGPQIRKTLHTKGPILVTNHNTWEGHGNKENKGNKRPTRYIRDV